MEETQTTRTAIIIRSPHAGRSDRLAEALQHLQAQGVQVVDTLSIASLDDLPAQGKRWRASGIDVALAAGGDGVVGGVITHIIDSDLALGIIPLGTSNDIARSLNIPLDLAETASVIARGNAARIDVGEGQPAQQAPHKASSHPRGPVSSQVSRQKHAYFAHALTIGLNVQFARLATNVVTRRRFGRMTYPLAAVEVMAQHTPVDITLSFEGALAPQQSTTHPTTAQLDNIDIHCRALQVAVINAPIFGGRWRFAIPAAAVDDRLLDIVVFEEANVVKNLSAALAHLVDSQQPALPQAGTGHHPADLSQLPGIHHIQARGVMIATSTDPQDVTLDGEVRGQTPAFVRVADEQLRVIVPRR
jgi:diacylglycerol kinase (ATP)